MFWVTLLFIAKLCCQVVIELGVYFCQREEGRGKRSFTVGTQLGLSENLEIGRAFSL